MISITDTGTKRVIYVNVHYVHYIIFPDTIDEEVVIGFDTKRITVQLNEVDTQKLQHHFKETK